MKAEKKLVTLKKNKEFAFVYRKGRAFSQKHLLLLCFVNKYGGLRTGFSVSKKVGGAVKRNKVRRRLKEALRVELSSVKLSAAAVIVAKPGSYEISYGELRRQLLSLLKKAGLN